MTRPRHLVAFCGTATEIGKTWVGARTAEALLARGHRVAARKPVQSFDPGDEGPTDADVLGAATGADPVEVCPGHRWYPVPMAPPMATDHLGLPAPVLDELLAELAWPAGLDVGIVETVGGVRSPIADDGDSRELVRRLGVDSVVLVADAGLGTIDAVRNGVEALAPHPVLVLLNRFDAGDELHRRNRAWLAERDGFAVFVDVEELAGRLVAD